MENNEIKVEKSIDDMLNHLNSINDEFINNYFDENQDKNETKFTEAKEKSTDDEKITDEESSTDEERLTDDESSTDEEKLTNEVINYNDEVISKLTDTKLYSKRLFGLNEEIKKTDPGVDDIIDLIDSSTNGEDFFDKIEGEFFD